MPDAEQQGFDTAVAPAEHVHWPRLQVFEERRKIVGHLFIGDVAGAVAGLALIAAVHRDHAIARAEELNLRGQGSDAAAVAVDDQERFALAVHLVVQGHAVVDEGLTGTLIRAVWHRRDLRLQRGASLRGRRGSRLGNGETRNGQRQCDDEKVPLHGCSFQDDTRDSTSPPSSPSFLRGCLSCRPNTGLSCEAPFWLGFVSFNSLFCGIVF
jgi:hypothetical protein